MNRLSIIILSFLTLLSCIAYGQRGVLKGTVMDDTGTPLENMVIIAIDQNLSTFTNSYGHFTMQLPTGKDVRLLFQQMTYKDTIITVRLKPSETYNLAVVLPAQASQLDMVSIQAQSEQGYITVNPKLSFQMPSPGGGMESLIKMLPGTYSTNELSSQYNVRGGNYDENLIFVNDIQIYRPFLIRNAQQEGMSFVNTDLAGNVIFSAGAFEAKYGDKISSVLDVQYKTPTQYGGSVSGSMLGATAHAEGRVNNVFSFLIGARFKANTYLLKSLQTKGDYKPRFFDTQMLLKWDVTKKFDISFLGNFSRNKYLYIPHDRETNFGTTTDMMRCTVYFDGQEVDTYENYLGGLTFTYRPTDADKIKLILSSYFSKESETYDIQSQYFLHEVKPDLGEGALELGDLRGYGTYLEHARNSISSVVSAVNLIGEHKLPYFNTLSWGVKAQNEIIHDKIKEWTMRDSSGYTMPFLSSEIGVGLPIDDPSRILDITDGNFLSTANDLSTFRFTGYIQDQWKIDGDSLTRFFLNAGVRFHYWTFNKKEFTVSPRLAFTYHPRWRHDWTFSLRTGIYYQPAFYREMRYADGTLNHDIKSQRSYQIVGSSEYNFQIWRRPFKFTTEVYYKYMDNLISYTLDNVRITYSGQNDAVGYATGLEMKLSGEFIRGLESWVAVSIMKTAEDIIGDGYEDENGNWVEAGYIPRPTDQRASFNIFFQDHVPGFPQFRVHLNFVFATPLPYSAPNAPAYMRMKGDSWYRRVDLGVSFMFLEQSRDRMQHKSKFLRSIKNAGIYVEAFNLLDINNISSYFWVTDLSNNQFRVPNYLTGRLINVKLMVEF
ncbi:MAG: TonB-dependent receptor [Bacteroidales bacterium]|nr:TonB-dependent receptor [Bacteroidales bacterium]